jgi:RNA polymerase sigma factor (TIGR02999 family)
MDTGSNDITLALAALNSGEPEAEDRLLRLVYEELRDLARSKMAREPAGHTLQATALVHEAFMKLAGQDASWDNRAHFFAAAAEAMRRILVDRARKYSRVKRGAGRRRVELHENMASIDGNSDQILAVDEALQRLEQVGKRASHVVKMRCFVGMTLEATSDALGISMSTVKSDWAYARAWLHREMERPVDDERSTMDPG